jgi:hypothetical protein
VVQVGGGGRHQHSQVPDAGETAGFEILNWVVCGECPWNAHVSAYRVKAWPSRIYPIIVLHMLSFNKEQANQCTTD